MNPVQSVALERWMDQMENDDADDSTIFNYCMYYVAAVSRGSGGQ